MGRLTDFHPEGRDSRSDPWPGELREEEAIRMTLRRGRNPPERPFHRQTHLHPTVAFHSEGHLQVALGDDATARPPPGCLVHPLPPWMEKGESLPPPCPTLFFGLSLLAGAYANLAFFRVEEVKVELRHPGPAVPRFDFAVRLTRTPALSWTARLCRFLFRVDSPSCRVPFSRPLHKAPHRVKSMLA